MAHRTIRSAGLAALGVIAGFSAPAGLGLACAVGVARAEELAPLQGASIALGEMRGIAYFTATSDGLELVATMGGGDGAAPVRFVTVLAPGQSASVSVPRGPGESDRVVTFTRRGDRIERSGGDPGMPRVAARE